MRDTTPSPTTLTFVIIAFLWTGAWAVQMNLPFLEYSPGVFLLLLPSGVKTLVVLIFGFRGAISVTVCSACAIFFKYVDDSLAAILLFAAITPFVTLFTLYLVCRFRDIPNTLAGLLKRDLIFIVVLQGLTGAALRILMVHLTGFNARYYESTTAAELIEYWFRVSLSDILPSAIILILLSQLVFWLVKKKAEKQAY